MNIGMVLRCQGLLEKALEEFNKALQIQPNFIIGLLCRGDLFRQIGNHKKAMADYQRVVTLDPTNLDGLYKRMSLLKDIGE